CAGGAGHGGRNFFGQRPTLMVVEPKSVCWVSGRLVERRDGETWLAELRGLSNLKDIVTDAGSGLCKGIKCLAGQRPAVRHGLDMFHLKREGNKALRRDYGAASRALEQAAAKQAEADKLRRRGQHYSNQAMAAGRRWRRAEELL